MTFDERTIRWFMDEEYDSGIDQRRTVAIRWSNSTASDIIQSSG